MGASSSHDNDNKQLGDEEHDVNLIETSNQIANQIHFLDLDSLEYQLEAIKSHLEQHGLIKQSASRSISSAIQKSARVNTSAGNAAGRKLLLVLAKLAHGYVETVAEVIYYSCNNDRVPEHPSSTTFKEILLTVLEVLSVRDFSSAWKVSNSCTSKFVESVTSEWPDQSECVERLTELLAASSSLKWMLTTAFKVMFANEVGILEKSMIPDYELNKAIPRQDFRSLLSFTDVCYLNQNITHDQKYLWRLLYSSAHQGESFTKLCAESINKGPLLIVIRDSNGHVFGGFISQSIQYSSEFQGDSTSFLFTAHPKLAVYTYTGFNDHFAYLNIGQETMPNGLGMGGQHFYFGLWIDSEFGIGQSKAKPKCTTYGSPQLSHDANFTISNVEVWGIGKEPTVEEDCEDEEGTSALDRNPEAAAILQIVGKERVSDGYREPEN